MEETTFNLLRGNQNPPEKLVKREVWDEPTFKRIIREMGLKVTAQRMSILNSLCSGRVHVTAQEVFEKVSEKNAAENNPEIGFATVYRFLRNLKEFGFVSEVRMGGLPARYELKPKHHHDHLTCTSCGKIVEFENPTIEAIQLEIAKAHGIELTGHVLELYGICNSCK